MLLKRMYIMLRSKTYKIPDTTNLATSASLNAKINEVKGVSYYYCFWCCLK